MGWLPSGHWRAMIDFLRDYFHRRQLEATFIDPNAQCPACGNREGKLRCVTVDAGKKNETNTNKTVMIEHTCSVCGARVYEDTVVKSENIIHPAVADAIKSSV
jgi:predicted nucleic-acid-binding Zn-ribbon protein